MKKYLKIAGITLGSLVGLLLVTLCVVCWLVLTPARLTPILSGQMERFITAPTSLGQVDVSLFSSFPNLELQVDNFVITNPMEGAPSDTVVSVGRLSGAIDVKAYLKNKEIVLHDLTLSRGDINIFTDASGKANYAIFPAKEEEIVEEPTTFDLGKIMSAADLKKIALEEVDIKYISTPDTLKAELEGVNLALNGSMRGETLRGQLLFGIEAIDLTISSDPLATDWPLSLKIPFKAEDGMATLDKATLSVADLIELALDGTLSKEGEAISTDLSLKVSDLDVGKTLAALPASFKDLVKDIDASGVVGIEATAKGRLAEGELPQITATLNLTDGSLRHPAIPLPINNIGGKLTATAEQKVGEEMTASALIEALSLSTPKSTATLSGKATNLLGDPTADLSLTTKVSLPEMAGLLPDTLPLAAEGMLSGTIKAAGRLSDLTAGVYEKLSADGNLALTDLSLHYDTLHIATQSLTTHITLPNPHPAENTFAHISLGWEELAAFAGNNLQARLQSGSGDVDLTNPMERIGANLALTIGGLQGSMEEYKADISQATLTGQIDHTAGDTLTIPSVTARLLLDRVTADASPMAVEGDNLGVTVAMRADPDDPSRPVVTLHYDNSALGITLGPDHTATLGDVEMLANMIIHNEEENPLLRFNPTGKVSIHNVNYNNPTLLVENEPMPIEVPEISLTFTPERFDIIDSRVVAGRSDFRLEGVIDNLTSFLRDEELLQGRLRFSSQQTDINQLMALTSGIGYTEEELSEGEMLAAHAAPPLTEEATEEAIPFMVPKGVSLRLDVDIADALIGNDSARGVKGTVSVEDGTLVLDDLHFTTSATEMHLTAMYQSPRPNHLFVGLDCHMLDIEIGNLLNLFPEMGEMMPMLRSFGGGGEFHIAAETNLDRNYNLKPSTIRGAASLRGEDLVLMDGETFTEISRLLRFNKRTENKIDSLSAEFTIFREEIDIYPFLVVMDEYKAIIGGRHNLDMSMDYNISLIHNPLIPIRLGLDITGNINDMKFRLAECKYADLYRPARQEVVETSQLALRELIRKALTRAVEATTEEENGGES